MLFASSIGQIFHPFYIAFAQVLAFFYELVPNYAVAIALLTIAVMILVFPVTLKGTRGMIKMQLLAPELKIIQNRHKPKPGMSAEERQASRQRLNEEMMALYKENNANPAGGCVPMFLQLPVFVILYGTIKGLIHKTPTGAPEPLYISHSSRLYNDIFAGHGQLHAFGINLADSVKSAGSWGHKAPFILLILIAIALQYIQMKQMSGRNPAAAAANPQMQTMQRVMPLIFAVIYISIPAGVNIYFIVSSLFRIAQQDAMYRWDPSLQAALERLQKNTPVPAVATSTSTGAGGLRSRFREAARGAAGSTNGAAASSTNGSSAKGNGAAPKGAAFTPPRVQQNNRSKDKKPRRSR